jgi:predicted metal-binding protein
LTEIGFDPSILEYYFDLKVVQACRACKRYGTGQCPPNVPDIEYYKKLLPSYKHGTLIFKKFEINGAWKEQGRNSSLYIHKRLLEKQNQLLNEGYYYSIILGAGSCKACVTCVTPCRQPDKAIVPIEGCGIDVVALMKRLEVDISFPVDKQRFFYRIGMILWN